MVDSLNELLELVIFMLVKLGAMEWIRLGRSISQDSPPTQEIPERGFEDVAMYSEYVKNVVGNAQDP